MSGLPAPLNKPLERADLALFDRLFQDQSWKPIDRKIRDAIIDRLTVCFFNDRIPLRDQHRAYKLLLQAERQNIALAELVVAALEASQPKAVGGLPARELSLAERIAHVDRIIEEGIASGAFEDDEKAAAEGVSGAPAAARREKRRRPDGVESAD